MSTRVLVVFYSMTGRTAALARAIAQGAEEQQATVRLRRVKELFSEGMLADRPKLLRTHEDLKHIPVASQEDVYWADGIAFGSPTRFGTVSTQLKTFLESVEEIAPNARLHEKVASVFTSTTEKFGGKWTTVPVLVSLASLGFTLLGHQPLKERTVLEIFKEFPFAEPIPPSEEDEEGPTYKDLESARILGQQLAFTAGRLRIRQALDEAA